MLSTVVGMLVVAACLINWLVTKILVESHLFSQLRAWIVAEATHVKARDEWHQIGNKHYYVWPEDATEEEVEAAPQAIHGSWGKLAQLVTCWLCTGVWVGFAEAAVFGGPFTRWFIMANGLLYAAGGHVLLVLEHRLDENHVRS